MKKVNKNDLKANLMAEAEKRVQQIRKEQPKIPEEGIKRIKRDLFNKAYKTQLEQLEKQNFNDIISTGTNFLKMKDPLLDITLYHFDFDRFEIGIGIGIDLKLANTMYIVACLCTPEDCINIGWKDYIARGLLGYRLKLMLENETTPCWYNIAQAKQFNTNKWIEARKALMDLIGWGIEDINKVPRCFVSSIKKAMTGYGLNLSPIIKIIKLSKKK